MAGRFELRVLQQCTRQDPRVSGAATLEKTIGDRHAGGLQTALCGQSVHRLLYTIMRSPS